MIGYKKYYEVIDQLGLPLNIVIVGANDGMSSEPLYEYFKPKIENLDQYNFLFIEPLIFEASRIELPYRKFPNKRVLPIAISSESKVPLYFHGVFTSSNKEHLMKYHIRTTEPMLVPGYTLEQALEFYPKMQSIDILQVDVEGMEDEVLYVSSLEKYNPKIILFESLHLPEDRKQKLLNYIESLGYTWEVLADTYDDVLCVKGGK